VGWKLAGLNMMAPVAMVHVAGGAAVVGVHVAPPPPPLELELDPAGEFDVGVFEGLLDALPVAGYLAD
jgi:hypothetical protein